MKRLIYFVFLSIIIYSCHKFELLVITEGNSNITSTSVTLSGQIEDIGHDLVIQHGHCWSISSSPVINDSKTSLGTIGEASFTSNALSLTPSTTYYYRAYATNSCNTVYGTTKTFTTQAPPPPSGPCNITSVSSSPYTISITPTPNIFSFDDEITILLYHPFYSGSQWSIYLYEDETLITSLGGALLFLSTGNPGYYSRTVTLPGSSIIAASNCYTIRTVGVAGGANAYVNISDPITID